MNFKEILERLTGLSCPIFGISWNPPEPETTVAKRIITFLEDRRVLYSYSQRELSVNCIKSVLEIRKYLTTELAELSSKNELNESLRAMRAACRKFLTKVSRQKASNENFPEEYSFGSGLTRFGALGELRGVFGVHIDRIAAKYGFDIEDDLASILPGKDED
jgi:hypothetical protein